MEHSRTVQEFPILGGDIWPFLIIGGGGYLAISNYWGGGGGGGVPLDVYGG